MTHRENDERALFEAWRYSLGGAQDDGIAVKFVPTLPPIAWEAWQAGRAALQQQAGVPDAALKALRVAIEDFEDAKTLVSQGLAKRDQIIRSIDVKIKTTRAALDAAIAAAPTLGGAKG